MYKERRVGEMIIIKDIKVKRLMMGDSSMPPLRRGVPQEKKQLGF